MRNWRDEAEAPNALKRNARGFPAQMLVVDRTRPLRSPAALREKRGAYSSNKPGRSSHFCPSNRCNRICLIGL